jgi:acyl dehydratase
MAASTSTLAFEDLTPGRTFTLPPRALTREEIVRFAREWDPQPFHLDEEAARRSHFGGLIASGWQTASLCMRLVVDALLKNSTSMGSPAASRTGAPSSSATSLSTARASQ